MADFGDGWGIDLKDGRLAACIEIERKADEAERNAKTLAALRERVEGWSESDDTDTDDVLRMLDEVERILKGHA
jgi:predicted kinase